MVCPRRILRQAGKTLSKAVSGDDQMKLLMAYLSAMQYYAFVMKHRDYKYVMSSLNQAKPLVLMDINQLDVNPYLLNTPEATYDLRLGLAGVQEHDPMDYLTKCTNASPGEAGKDLWLDTVRQGFLRGRGFDRLRSDHRGHGRGGQSVLRSSHHFLRRWG